MNGLYLRFPLSLSKLSDIINEKSRNKNIRMNCENVEAERRKVARLGSTSSAIIK